MEVTSVTRLFVHARVVNDALDARQPVRRKHRRRAMRRLVECRSRNHFPTLQGDGDWEIIDLPRWA